MNAIRKTPARPAQIHTNPFQNESNDFLPSIALRASNVLQHLYIELGRQPAWCGIAKHHASLLRSLEIGSRAHDTVLRRRRQFMFLSVGRIDLSRLHIRLPRACLRTRPSHWSLFVNDLKISHARLLNPTSPIDILYPPLGLSILRTRVSAGQAK